MPTGAFGSGQGFNLIFRACCHCNAAKAEVERHVSSVALYTSPARADDETDALARRKAAKDYHPDQRGRLVQDSSQTIKVGSSDGYLSISADILVPPQLNPEYVHRLATWHIQGLFAMVTGSDPRSSDTLRLLPSSQCHVCGYYANSDWGNVSLIELANRVCKWALCTRIHTADGFFRAIMRRDEEETGEWFWALEWNKSIRLVGGICEPGARPAIFADLPQPQEFELGSAGDEQLVARTERRLDPDEDTLFG